MALANCPNCSKLFNNAFRPICPDCIRLEDEQFFKVRDYLKVHRNATAVEVSDSTDVPLKTIYKFIREGRLLQFPLLQYECPTCGNLLTPNEKCTQCKNVLAQVQERLTHSQHTDTKPLKGGYHHNKRGE